MLFGGFRPADNSNDVRDDGEGFKANALVDPGKEAARRMAAIKPDVSAGEAPEVPIYEASRGPGSTADVDYWTSKDVRDVMKSHLNYVVADTKVWEQSAAYILDTHPKVDAFVNDFDKVTFETTVPIK